MKKKKMHMIQSITNTSTLVPLKYQIQITFKWTKWCYSIQGLGPFGPK
jgi:hypothetical protein